MSPRSVKAGMPGFGGGGGRAAPNSMSTNINGSGSGDTSGGTRPSLKKYSWSDGFVAPRVGSSASEGWRRSRSLGEGDIATEVLEAWKELGGWRRSMGALGLQDAGGIQEEQDQSEGAQSEGDSVVSGT